MTQYEQRMYDDINAMKIQQDEMNKATIKLLGRIADSLEKIANAWGKETCKENICSDCRNTECKDRGKVDTCNHKIVFY